MLVVQLWDTLRGHVHATQSKFTCTEGKAGSGKGRTA